jgi:Zn-dependent protease with chaperone function
MKPSVLAALLAVIALAAALLAGPAEPARPGAAEEAVIARPVVRLRQGPGPIFPVVDVVRRGTLVRMSEASADKRWKRVVELAAKKDEDLENLKTFGPDAPAWIAVRDLAVPATKKEPEPPAVASADEVKVVAASVAACIRGFDDNVIAYLDGRKVDPHVLEQLFARPFTPEQYWAFAAERLGKSGFQKLDVPVEIPEDYADAVTMDRLAAMVGASLVDRLGGKLVNDPGRRGYVARVGMLLADASPRYELSYRFILIDDEKPNTFCAPGGIIVLTTGVFDLCRDESELAALLAHELAHIVLQHAERSPENTARTVGIDVEGLWTDLGNETRGPGEGKKETEKELANLADWFLTVTLLRPRRTKEELEADRLALYLLARARYDTGALRRVITRLDERKAPPLFEDKPLRNHPTGEERLEAVRKTERDYRKLDGKRLEAPYRKAVTTPR